VQGEETTLKVKHPGKENKVDVCINCKKREVTCPYFSAKVSGIQGPKKNRQKGGMPQPKERR